jgi:hypothetical protein
MTPDSIILLEFNAHHDHLKKGKRLRDGLSVVLQIADTLWVANDETMSLERLSLVSDDSSGVYGYGRHHTCFALKDYLELPEPPAGEESESTEVDVEGLAYEQGYLWIVGSHSLKRDKPAVEDRAKAARKALAGLSAEASRYLLGRIPVTEENGTLTLAKNTIRKGKQHAAAHLQISGRGNALTEALMDDEHLGPFLAIPGKENGFDIEGLAVAGDRLFIGLRGPVLRGWAVILEVELKESDTDPQLLKLRRIGPAGRRYRKHFLQLGGLGIRDLCVQNTDLLILAGPTMHLDGPVSVFRWRGGTAPKAESLLQADELDKVVDLAFGKGVDHPEGICLYAPNGNQAQSLLVVHDAASVSRQVGRNSLIADVFHLS